MRVWLEMPIHASHFWRGVGVKKLSDSSFSRAGDMITDIEVENGVM